jgi:alkylation response protein AidB-like acyl-CoA dehydrogenase
VPKSSVSVGDSVVQSLDVGAVETARALRDLFVAHADANEELGELHPEVVKALHANNLFALFIPRPLGGLELDPVTALETIEEVSYADGATGWVLFAIAVTTGTGAGYLPDLAVSEIFGPGKNPAIAGQGIPNGRAVPVEGGYQLTGAWNYGSGIKHADYVHSGALVFEGGALRMTEHGPDARIFVVPSNKVQLGENWDVLGLKATGSVDYSIHDLFVPEHFTHPAVSQSNDRGNIFGLGIMGLGAIGHTGFALGVGRRILDELAAFARSKSGKPGAIGDSESFLEQFAAAEAKFRAARALVYETWANATAALAEHGKLDTRQVTLVRLALNHVTWTVSDIAMFGYRAGGGTSLRSGILQRLFRDIHGGTQHITSSAPILREMGKELAGLAPGKIWSFLGLVDAK